MCSMEDYSPALPLTRVSSPGDDGIGEPYLYVGPWYPDTLAPDDLWNGKTFRGAVLPWSELQASPDQRTAALDFYRRCRRALQGA